MLGSPSAAASGSCVDRFWNTSRLWWQAENKSILLDSLLSCWVPEAAGIQSRVIALRLLERMYFLVVCPASRHGQLNGGGLIGRGSPVEPIGGCAQWLRPRKKRDTNTIEAPTAHPLGLLDRTVPATCYYFLTTSLPPWPLVEQDTWSKYIKQHALQAKINTLSGRRDSECRCLYTRANILKSLPIKRLHLSSFPTLPLLLFLRHFRSSSLLL